MIPAAIVLRAATRAAAVRGDAAAAQARAPRRAVFEQAAEAARRLSEGDGGAFRATGPAGRAVDGSKRSPAAPKPEARP